MWDLNSRVNPGIEESDKRRATGNITVSIEIMLSIPAANMVVPWILYFFCLTTMKPTTSMPKDRSCRIMLSSLLKGAVVFSRLAMW